MRKNLVKSSMVTVVFAETALEIKWAISYFKSQGLKNFAKYIIPITDEAQVELVANGYSYLHLLKLTPSRQLKAKYLKWSHEFAVEFYRNPLIYKNFLFRGYNLGYYFINLCTNFIPLVCYSYEVVNNIINTYHPHKLIIFDKLRDLTPNYIVYSTESLVIESCLSASHPKILIEKIKLNNFDFKPQLKRLSYTNIKKYSDLIIEKPTRIITFTKYLLSLITHSNELPLTRGSYLLLADSHVLVNSIPLIKEMKTNKLKVHVIGASLLLSHRLDLKESELEYSYYNLQANLPVHYPNFEAKWHSLKTNPQFLAIIKKYHFQTIQPLLLAKLDNHVHNLIPRIINHLIYSENIVSKVRPQNVILFGNYWLRNLSLALAARKKQIKIWVIQHGIMPIPKTIYSPIFDHMLVWGSIEKKIHVNYLKLPKDKVKIAGWFYIDDLIRRIINKSTECKPINRKNIRILFLTNADNYNNGVQVITIYEMIKELSKMKNVTLIIRPHPGHTVSKRLPQIVPTTCTVSIEWDFGKNLDEQLQSSDIIITQATTVALRAMIWHKPVIHLTAFDMMDICEFSKFGAAVKVDEINKLVPSINKIINNKRYRTDMLESQDKLLFAYGHNLNGQAIPRIIKLIQKQP